MAKFIGFDDWVEIFRGGRQIDSEGIEHDGDALVDSAVQNFSAAHHEPPLVFGHPKDDSPAYGWVEELKSEVRDDGKVLLARFKDIADGVEQLIKDGRYRKRSAAFYPDGTLRHVGWLGAVPPAVKGLADLKFKEEESTTFEFSDFRSSLLARIIGKVREYLIEKEGVEKADRVIDAWDVDSLKEEADLQETVPVSFTESPEKEESAMGESNNETTFTQADLDAARAEGKEEARQEAATAFAEQQKKKVRDEAIAKIKEFCKRSVEQGGPPPVLLDAGLQEFLEGLDCHTVIEFSEEKKATGLDWFLSNFNAVLSPEFGEHAKGEGVVLDDPHEIAKLAIEFQEKEAQSGRTITLTDAVNRVTKKAA